MFTDDQLNAARAAAAGIDADVILLNTELWGFRDFDAIATIAAARSRPNALLVLITNGGDPDGAYRISRYLQENYEKVTVLIPGRCKSAGTLLAIGASELAFMPYGELGPLDIQLTKVDRFDQAQSGLTIQDALNTLESRATESFFNMVKAYMEANNGLLSFASASKAASEFVTKLYAPVFGRIDPEEVGARSRSMRIADDYGKRLSAKWSNAKGEAVKKLAETYSSHSFVIDKREAQNLFVNVRDATTEERALVEVLGFWGRFQLPRDKSAILALSTKLPPEEQTDVEDQGRRGPQDGGNPEGAERAEDAPPGGRRRRLRAVPPAAE
jgi:hypothetical protein